MFGRIGQGFTSDIFTDITIIIITIAIMLYILLFYSVFIIITIAITVYIFYLLNGIGLPVVLLQPNHTKQRVIFSMK